MSARPVLAVAPAARRAPDGASTGTARSRASGAVAARASGPPRPAVRGAATAPASGPDPDVLARRALDVGRRTALGVLAGDAATADDVAQEVAIQALRHAHLLRDPDALDGWLHRTAVRAALRTVRRSRRRRVVEHDHAAIEPRAAEPEPVSGLEDLGRLLAGLPERQRAALTLRYAHDLDDERIAAALGCRVGTVRALLSRGRGTLRARMGADQTISEDPDA